ncbi:hypothetical protein MYU51_009821 [Penicillium brevicompactum]|uniref:uncharacterized protein n=1 Tax=Penicillium brevicompactum TaxID=5074 RepID=UPI0025405282|nr:uncharacterized protein N7506_001039 [Penicillium brevicompactum]KAJ5347786.1 hypothetical protein N7506_001039 [Penicillium brevicompactum]
MSSLFSKRLTCFYCGQRPTQVNRPIRGPVRNFHCEHCEADNFFDEKGEITDPPAVVTNAEPHSPGASSPSGTTDLNEPPLFCAKCTRNQHLFTSSLASYFPPSDDPTDSEYDRGYDQFRRSLEDRYPQVCEICEPRVKSRIRKAGYEAKSDHLRRMMDQSRMNRESRQARNRSWRSLLLVFGACAYWTSIAGQISWDLLAAITVPSSGEGMEEDEPNTMLSCVSRSFHMWRVPGDCCPDLAPTAGLALVAGALSLWWNPKLRFKIDGQPGKFGGLAEYYQAQLIVMVVRCVFWAVLKDPSASGLDPNLPRALHALMAPFTILSVLVSRYLVSYSSRPLVNWSDNSWETRLEGAKASSPAQAESPAATRIHRSGGTPKANDTGFNPRFPIDKLATSRPPVEQSVAVAQIQDESDTMDWSPSVTHDLRPTRTQRNEPSVLSGPHPFQGHVPAAPTPPAWKLRNQIPSKSIDRVIQPNPFHRTPTPTSGQSQQKPRDADTVFNQPKFFAPGDLDTSTGLETLFDRAFNFQPDGAQRPGWDQNTYKQGSPRLIETQSYLFWGCLRLGLLVGFTSAWTFSQNHQVLLPGNYVEIAALGVASLVAGFALISMVKRPLSEWNGTEILISITELGAAVHMGAHLPTASLNRDYFDRYGKLLLLFMVLQEVMNVLSFYKDAKLESQKPPGSASPPTEPQSPVSQSGALDWPADRSSDRPSDSAISTSLPRVSSPPVHRSFGSQSTAPALSFGDTEAASSFSSALPSVPQYGLTSSQTVSSFPAANQNAFQQNNNNPHSFTMETLKQIDPVSDYEQESDSETVATTTTAATNFTNRNIRYGTSPALGSGSMFSPRRTGLGSGMGGLSLDDEPTPRRMTRSQTQHGLLGRRPANYVR